METGFEKGCLIQLLPKSVVDDKNYWQTVYDKSKFIYPPKIEMTPHESDAWVIRTLTRTMRKPEYWDYVLDKIIYWRIEHAKCVLIHRDRPWFAQSLPKFKQMWKYVLFFRKHPDKLEILVNYINSLNKKMNNKIMSTVRNLYYTKKKNYDKIVKKIVRDTKRNESKRKLTKKKEKLARRRERDQDDLYDDFIFDS